MQDSTIYLLSIARLFLSLTDSFSIFKWHESEPTSLKKHQIKLNLTKNVYNKPKIISWIKRDISHETQTYQYPDTHSQ